METKPMTTLKNLIAVVTGASGGVGSMAVATTCDDDNVSGCPEQPP